MAATYFVKGSAAPGGNGSTWTKAYRTIQPAVDAAKYAGGGEVWVAGGAYTGAGDQVVNIPETVKVYGGFAGNESVRSERNPTSHKTVIDGQQARRGVNNYGLLDGLWIQNGNISSSGYGGGVYNNRGTVTNCTVTSSSACSRYGYGGGVYNDRGTVTNCTVTANSAGGEGGGVYNYTGTVTNCTVTANSTSYVGGGVYNFNYGTVTNCTVTSNSADGLHYSDSGYGGGIYNDAHGTVTNCTVTANSASNLGGGVCNDHGTVTNCTVTANSAFDAGGGVDNYGGTVTNCKVTANSAFDAGGGVYNRIYGTVTNCTVTANSASIGGGVYNYGTVTNCTVTANSADDGGGVFNDDYGTVTNCIVWRNFNTDIEGDLAQITYSCFKEATQSNNNLGGDPRFVSITGSDSRAWDLRLRPDSPCIGAGTKAAPSMPATDLTGRPRPGGDGLVDLGAYEHGKNAVKPEAWAHYE